MRLRRQFIAMIPLVVGVGCSKGTPSFSVLDQAIIPRPTFDQKTEKTVSVAGLGVTTALEGECDPRIRSISAVVVGVGKSGSLASISTNVPSVTCATTGKFSFTLKALDQLLPNAQANQNYRIELRADTTGGVSDPTTLTVVYTKEDAERWHLTSGGTESGSGARGMASALGTFKADLRVTHFVNAADATSGPAQTTASSAHFQLRYGRANQAH